MESQPRYVIVGIFLTLLTLVSLGFVFWIYGYRGEKADVYVILTEEAVNGLRVGSPVRYKGVDVGKVSGISIDPKDPEVIRIFLKIKKGVPIHADTVAMVLPQGITGLSYISLSGGRKGKPFLVKLDGKVYPVIRLELSGIQKISRSLPELMARVDELVTRLNMLLSNETISNIGAITANLRMATKELLLVERRLQKVLSQTDRLAAGASSTMRNLNDTLSRINDLVCSLNETSNTFREQVLYEAVELLKEARSSVKRADMLIQELEARPSVLIYGR